MNGPLPNAQRQPSSALSGKPRPRIRIAFMWQTLTSENLGVGALAQSQIAIARAAALRAGVEIEGIEFSSSGTADSRTVDPEVTSADPLSPKNILLGRSRYIQQLKTCDLVLDIGAGDSFSDIYGAKHFAFFCLSKTIAIALRKPLVLSPQTIGPFHSRWAQLVAAMLMSRARRIFARDGLSMEYLRSLGRAENADEVIDVAFRLPFDRSGDVAPALTRVGINVSGLLQNGGYTKDNQFGLTVNHRELVEQLILRFSAMPKVEIHLVPHVLSPSLPVEDDYAAIVELKRRFPKTLLAPKFRSPSEAKSYIANMSFFTGARMHACIAAFSSGVPVVPMAYSRKFNGLFNSLGYMHIADMRRDTTAAALEKIIDGFENRNDLIGEIDRGNRTATEKLQKYEDYLTDLFLLIDDQRN